MAELSYKSALAFAILAFTFSSVSARTVKLGEILSERNALEVQIVFGPDEAPKAYGMLGLALPDAVGDARNCEEQPPGIDCINWGDYAQLLLMPGSSPTCQRVEWSSRYARELRDCYDLTPSVHWYGGGEEFVVAWPIEQNSREETPVISADNIGDHSFFGGVVETYWLLSNGAAVIIDKDTPLWYSLNSTEQPNRVCFTARDSTPFPERDVLTLKYEWCGGSDVKSVHQMITSAHFDKPDSIPDENMLLKPFWSTWAKFHADVNQEQMLSHARKIISEGFSNSSHFEIDDKWEACYGDETFDLVKFPDPKGMVDEMHSLGLKVTLWVHPFVNLGCEPFAEGLRNGYFVKTPKGRGALTSWWAGSDAGMIDVFNEEAVEWWFERLHRLQNEIGIDSFKFDAGESNWLPAGAILSTDEEYWPQAYTTKYVEVISRFGGMIEARAAFRNQKEPVFIRLMDRDTRWGYDSGLKSVIPGVLHFGLLGYSFALPDMIGGTGFTGLVSKELFIRWTQVNIFMPSVQFSLVPWDYDQETVNITLDVISKREKYSNYILKAARQSVIDGTPMNRPIWWVDPTDNVTYTIDDEYMLGDDILVAPCVEEGRLARDIYLPKGTWWMESLNLITEGPVWLYNYHSELSVVPFFIKMEDEVKN